MIAERMKGVTMTAKQCMAFGSGNSRTRDLGAVAVKCLAILAALLGLAVGPAWRIDSVSNPTAAPGSQLQFIVRITNVGDRPAPETPGGDADNCTPGATAPSDPAKCYSVTATFPPGLTPVDGTPIQPPDPGFPCTIDGGRNAITCAVSGSTTEEQVAAPMEAGASPLDRELLITAAVESGSSGWLTSTFEVTGAGAPGDTVLDSTLITTTIPEFGVSDFDGEVTADATGTAFTQAAGHPFAASTTIEFNAFDNLDLPDLGVGSQTVWPVEATKDLVVDLPPGFIVDPTATAQCTTAQLANTSGTLARPLCPPASQIGTTVARMNSFLQGSVKGPFPVFNLVPTPDVPARFGFNVAGTLVLLSGELRSDGDYGVTANVSNVSQGLPVQSTILTLWGVPSDTSHDFERACPGQAAPNFSGVTCQSGVPRAALLRNPTACTPDGVGLITRVRTDSWQNPGVFKTAEFESHLPPAYPSPPTRWGRPQGPTGCERVPFDPKLTGQPVQGSRNGKPAGFTFDLTLPQTDDPDVIGQADLRKAVVRLPRGVRVSPSSANGLAGCTSAQIGLDTREDAACPDASKIGTMTITTPLLHEPLDGAIYLATPGDNPFGSLFAVYLVARGPGVVVKLPGHVSPDPFDNGRITATFDDNPQLPFSRIHLEFFGGDRAALVLPKKCGTYGIESDLTSWSGKTVSRVSEFSVGGDCRGGFTPGFQARTENPVAGESSPFLVRVTRDDEDEEISNLAVNMPEGLIGRISRVVLCGDVDAAKGSCPDGSQIGTVTVGAGAGPSPFFIDRGRAFIGGPYRGCDFSLVVNVPAVAGPFNLGTVVVRSAVCVNRLDATVAVISDPFPQQLEGVPLDVRDVRVQVGREEFWLNPTSCAEKRITGTIESTEGSRAAVSTRFQVGDCASLPFRPRMRLTVGGGRGRTRRGRTTPLSTTLRQPADQANLKFVQVTLPTTINARLTVINDACTRAEFDSGRCEDARTGTATAVTPVLRDPLRGGVYFVRNGNPLPDLFVALRGQVDFDLIGRITIPGSKRLRTTFDRAPDVPVSRFTLRLNGGREGSVGNAANLCSRRGRTARATVLFRGQNGKELQVRQRLKVRGCRARRGGRRGRGGRGRR